MNKSEFLAQLHDHLSVLPPEERQELMEDYEAHFTFALQNGKTEEEIAMELGNPAELAKEAIDGRFSAKEPVYWFNPNAVPEPTGPPIASAARPGRSGFASAMVYTGLFFLNMVAVPLLISLWMLGVSLATAAAGMLLSPVSLGLEYLVGNSVLPAKNYAVLVLMGLGILLALASKPVFKWLIRISKSYWTWNVQTAHGGSKS